MQYLHASVFLLLCFANNLKDDKSHVRHKEERDDPEGI